MLTPQQARGLAESDLFDPPPETPGSPDSPDPAASGNAPEPVDVPLPQRVGRYRIVRRIASGGMGTVYEAEQEQPHRRVAVKVLRPGVVSRETLRRFRSEIETLGRLQHPGIAQIFDAGTYDDGGGGVPWFAMEFVESATPITDFADAHGLALKQRVRLFLPVCEGVQHGHLRGVIHRDLKPQNILVGQLDKSTSQHIDNGGTGILPIDNRTSRDHQGAVGHEVGDQKSESAMRDQGPEVGVIRDRSIGHSPQHSAHRTTAFVKVIDFGVARSMGDDAHTSLTKFGQVLGTLPYMSPEQCDGDADVRSDVYALGVILYELLTGRLPFDLSSKSITTAMRVIQEQPPEKPGALDRALRGGLEAVLLKAIAKDRARRYQSVAELASDLRAWLAGEPVTARPPGLWMRLTGMIRRHPLVTTTAAAVVIGGAVIASSFVTNWWLDSPTHIDIKEDRSVAWLRSGLGRTRRTFGGERGSIVAAEIVRHDETDFVALCVESGLNNTGQQLHVYRLDDMDTPIWTTEVGKPFIEMPPLYFELPEGAPPQNLENAYAVHAAEVADVFAEIDGPELIVIHSHFCCSPWALRVYSLTEGQVLFEAWHLGMMRDVQWLSGPGYIIATADRHVRDEIAQYGWDDEPDGPMPYPKVVFALDPEVGATVAYLNKYEDPAVARHLRWYRVLLPRSLFDHAQLHAVAPFDPVVDGRWSFDLGINTADHTGFSLVVSDQGEITARQWGDQIATHIRSGAWVEPSLVDWPPDLLRVKQSAGD